MTTPFEIQLNTDNKWEHFDPLKRSSNTDIDTAVNALANHPLVVAILDSANVSMVIVNGSMQIIAANRALWGALGEPSAKALYGKRIGEAVCCVNADNEHGGCAASEDCHSCGSSRYILASQKSGEPSEGECLLVMAGPKGRSTSEFSVRATPVSIEGHAYTVVSLQDISDSKRRRVLERVFVHDLKNTLTGLLGWSDHLSNTNDGEDAETVNRLAKRLATEVEYYRTLLAIEAGDFTPVPAVTVPSNTLENVLDVFSRHQTAKSKTLKITQPLPHIEFATDPTLLERVLINMVKNALEATPEDGTVRVGCTADEVSCSFQVWNEGVIPKEISSHVFQRSFSTKSNIGRGIGTYSMKLFGEQVLGGKVWFTSTKEQGTTFHLDLPITAPVDL
jgi:nitrogen fixation/metabolism regulation signal transduction histidine kinase